MVGIQAGQVSPSGSHSSLECCKESQKPVLCAFPAKDGREKQHTEVSEMADQKDKRVVFLRVLSPVGTQWLSGRG